VFHIEHARHLALKELKQQQHRIAINQQIIANNQKSTKAFNQNFK